MEFFKDFAWAVPCAFMDALSKCYFVQGDTLYDNPKAYKAWDTKNLHYQMQVLKPSHRQGSSNVFKINWSTPLSLELTDYKQNFKKTFYDTTQGRLFSLLRAGDLKILDICTKEPLMPSSNAEIVMLLKDRFNE